MFIQSTTLVQTDLLGNQTDVLTADGVVPTVEDMIERLPVGSRPLPANYGLYQNRYNLRCCYEMRVLGETGDGLLVSPRSATLSIKVRRATIAIQPRKARCD